jgi:hypothetical protein
VLINAVRETPKIRRRKAEIQNHWFVIRMIDRLAAFAVAHEWQLYGGWPSSLTRFWAAHQRLASRLATIGGLHRRGVTPDS